VFRKESNASPVRSPNDSRTYENKALFKPANKKSKSNYTKTESVGKNIGTSFVNSQSYYGTVSKKKKKESDSDYFGLVPPKYTKDTRSKSLAYFF